MLTRRAAIILDDTPGAWGHIEGALLAHVYPTKTIKHWMESRLENKVNFNVYMEALASHGAEVKTEPENDSGSNKYTLTPTDRSELSNASERLKMLHEYATKQYMLSASSLLCGKVCEEKVPRTPALLDVLLPVTRINCDDHIFALGREQHKREIACAQIGQLKRRVRELENNR